MVENSILLGFIEEAQNYLPVVRNGIVEFQGDESKQDELMNAYRHLHTIKGAALMIGLPDLSELAGHLENVLEKVLDGKEKLAMHVIVTLLAKIDQLENALESCAREANTASNDADGFSQSDTENFAFDEFETANDVVDDAQKFDKPKFQPIAEGIEIDEDVDVEMLEIFALEAEDHLQNISSNLRLLEENPQHKQALQEIRRSSHTLKGAAGVVGFTAIMNLSHRMEDLLDYLAEKPAFSTPKTTTLLMSAIDVLETLARGGSEKSVRAELDDLTIRFDRALSIETVAEQDVLTPVFTQKLDVETLKDNAFGLSLKNELEFEKLDGGDVLSHNIIINETEKSAAIVGNSFEAHAVSTDLQQTQNAPRTVVRVGLERLDELVKLMGEMIISRTVLEQRLGEIESQVAEMHLTTNRLRRIAGKLEIDYEANALGGKMAAKSFAPVFIAAQQSANIASQIPVQNIVDEDKYGFDDLEFDRYTEFHQMTRELVETSSDTVSITSDLDELLSDFDMLLIRQRRLADDMQDKLMHLRMVPLNTLSNRLHRTVRVVADQQGKLADFEIIGENVELDTQSLDALADPLLHLLRNAVAHGIETTEQRIAAGKPMRGRISLKAFHEGTHIVITINDDGRGIDTARLREKAINAGFVKREEVEKMDDEQALSLVFLTGLSTTNEVNQVSGRGVGMDIVRESVLRQQGTIALKSIAGKGVTTTIRLPMSLAVTRALLIKAFGEQFAIPLNMIQQLAQISGEDFDTLANKPIIWLNGKCHPVFTLNSLLKLPELPERDETRITTLLVNTGENTVALTIDEIVEAREIVIKPLTKTIKNLRGVIGATVLGDGSVVPILDLPGLLERVQKVQSVKGSSEAKNATNIRNTTNSINAKNAINAINIMIVDDSPSVRRVMTNFATKAGLKVVAAKDGLEAVEMLQLTRTLPDVILSDVEMPRMDGYELLATLKRQEAFKHIPVVMITSRASDKHRQKALDLGASDYVTKPYQDAVLLNVIKTLANPLR
ncbi:MAG: response regulator [Pyrinomonadaceae bacterium]|nr:response regulator [Pyrinomonadaceae bacterium]